MCLENNKETVVRAVAIAHASSIVLAHDVIVTLASTSRLFVCRRAQVSSSSTADCEEDMLSGAHHWHACSHARPTYCNVCQEALSGVTSHGLSCEGRGRTGACVFVVLLSAGTCCRYYCVMIA